MTAATKSWTLSVEQQELLIKSCFEAKEFSYTPYSKFPVGAALLTADGRVIKGACIDNVTYAGSICAERTALVKAASEGIRSFIGLAVTTNVAAPISPCGMCRQFIREFCSDEMPILLVPVDYYDTEKWNLKKVSIQVTNLGELLPFSFGPEDLELSRKSS
ncbi:cytidine deaminase [Thelephora ganbajun]|uniref:Cytidine deaminase n=1 Tax=Thelephora ganbajun TaxID=370292 RepID=A0ACB6ZQU0_THEGA|nr:cytidine deaminase [Thelephora ganbajun]